MNALDTGSGLAFRHFCDVDLADLLRRALLQSSLHVITERWDGVNFTLQTVQVLRASLLGFVAGVASAI
ncbi:hypothetical protein [Pseudomonas sp. K2I15]|uniref:hypothetical protein n=1 Tax=Pseudomonas sp. K2I15 TaxID=2013577 RepID=UPI00113066AB|nr:hypothetical protein [Pseudomonas sp. K2I15]